MCEHSIVTKIENGIIVSYCCKCGKIMDSKPVQGQPSRNDSISVNWVEGGLCDNGGQILHD